MDSKFNLIVNDSVISHQLAVSSEDVIIYGWGVEYSYNNLNWVCHINRKIYSSEKIALEAIRHLQHSKTGKIFFRLTPLYRLSSKLLRYLKIDDVLSNEN